MTFIVGSAQSLSEMTCDRALTQISANVSRRLCGFILMVLSTEPTESCLLALQQENSVDSVKPHMLCALLVPSV